MKMMKKKFTRILTIIMILSFGLSNSVIAAEINNNDEKFSKVEEQEPNKEVVESSGGDIPGNEQNSVGGSGQNVSSEEVDTSQDEGTPTEEKKINKTENGLINYIAIESPYLETPSEQKIVVSYGDGSEQISEVNLICKNENETISIGLTEKKDETYLFSHVFSSDDVGVYELIGFSYIQNGQAYSIDFKEIGMQPMFGVDMYYPGYEGGEICGTDSVGVETSIVNVAMNEVSTADESIEDAIASTVETVQQEDASASSKMARTNFEQQKNGSNVVVVLDPGHGGNDGGASANDLVEKDLTLKIAKYCKEELEQYSGVTVYMTRESDVAVELSDRVEMAKNWGANVFVSLHINSANSGAYGVEVWSPNSNYNSAVYEQGEELSINILNELATLGLYNRGIKFRDSENNTRYPDNSIADYYSVIRNSKLNGFPGIIVEHAFISNENDAEKLSQDSWLKKMGIADATGIANYFGLTKGYWETGTNGEKYYYEGGEKVTGEKYISGKWFYFDPNKDGAMATGFHEFANKIVYYGTDGAMLYGEQRINGKWYYFDTVSGAMATGFHEFATKTVCYGTDGAMLYGEQRINGKWYYFDTVSGAMATGFHKFEAKTVCYGADGAMLYGEQQINGKWYYFDTVSGAMATGFHEFEAKTVYYGAGGAMLYGEQQINGKWYYFDTVSGAMATGFHELSSKTVYYDLDGVMLYGQQLIEGKWYYFNPITGALIEEPGWVMEDGKVYYYTVDGKVTGEKNIEGKWYYFDSNEDGAMVTGFYKLPTKTVYYGSDGDMKYGEQYINGYWYYFHPVSGAMMTGFCDLPNKTVYYNSEGKMIYGDQIIDGISYYFDSVTGALDEKSGWFVDNDKTYYYEADNKVTGEKNIDGHWYYFDSDKDGIMVIGFHKFPAKTVYYGTDGAMRYGEQYINGHWYYFDLVTGAMIIGFHEFANKTVYYNQEGQMLYGEQTIDGKNYAFDTVTGAMIINDFFNGKYYGSNGEQQAYYIIEGISNTNIDQMIRYYNSNKGNREYPTEALTKGGAPNIETLATIFYQEACQEGIKAEVAWAQTMKETGFLQFGGQVKIEQFNFAGLGATDGGSGGASFADVRTGVRAQIQHLKAYSCATITKNTLSNPCVDPRFDYVSPKGCATYVEWLGQKENPYGKGWATAVGYGIDIANIIQKILVS
ncbi:N-acetylmuramoyl-L-alanine amidase [Bariatricus sp. SGI.019]|uniref:N-acetylmuramoyl-L-alanine amidase n=1 Tax=Bariatricus sp. SGI.019 TaxID=3420548 RepID=UPI003D017FE1